MTEKKKTPVPIPYFRISVHDVESPYAGWVVVKESVAQFAIRDVIEELYADGYTRESILIEAV